MAKRLDVRYEGEELSALSRNVVQLPSRIWTFNEDGFILTAEIGRQVHVGV